MTTTETTKTISSQALFNVITRNKKNNGAIFTLKSLKSGADFTYRISRKEFKGNWYTHISVETGYLNFTYLGSYFNGKLYRKGGVVVSNTAQAIAFVLKCVERKEFNWLDSNMEVMHTGNCLCCGRILTDAHSIKIGLGPVCASM
jgi:hypothetical protein